MKITREPIRSWMALALRKRARHFDGIQLRGDACWGTYTTLGHLYTRALLSKGRTPHADV